MSNGWTALHIPKHSQPTKRWDMIRNGILHPRSRKARNFETPVVNNVSLVRTSDPQNLTNTWGPLTRTTKMTRHITGPNLEPVMVEYETGRYCLGYLCDMSEDGTQLLIDVMCFGEPLRWFPASKVYSHSAADLDKLRPYSAVLVAVRHDNRTPYVFQPVRMLFIGRAEENHEDASKELQMYSSRCRTNLVYVETLLPDNTGNLTRAFLHPHQIRAGTAENGMFHLVLLKPSNLTHRTVHLEADQKGEKIDLNHLLDTVISSFRNTDRWKWLLRIRIDEQSVHFSYREPYRSRNLEEEDFKVIIGRALQRSIRELTVGKPITHDKSLVYLPFILQQLILLELEDIHSIMSAKRVCKVWYELLAGVGNKHVAIDIGRIRSLHSKWKELPVPGLYHLVAILSSTVNKNTIALTFIGSLSAELELAVYQFLLAKRLFIPMIQFKNACWHPLKQDASKQNLTLSNMRNLRCVCGTLRFCNVTVPSVFGPVAGMWCMPARDRYKTDLDVHIPLASLDCTKGSAAIVRQFLGLLNRYCPALSAAEWEKVKHLFGTILNAGSEYPYRQRLLLMLELLQNTETMSSGGYIFPQGSLSKLSAHSLRFSYYSTSAGQSQKHPSHPQYCITYAKLTSLNGGAAPLRAPGFPLLISN